MANARRSLLLAGMLFLLAMHTSAQLRVQQGMGAASPREWSSNQVRDVMKYDEDHPPVFPFIGVNWCGATMPELGINLSILHGRLPSEPVATARYSVLNLHLSGMLAIADQAVPAVRGALFYAPLPVNFLTVGLHADYFFHRDGNLMAVYPEAGLLLRPYAYKHFLETWKMPVFRLAYGYNVLPGVMPPGMNKHVVTLQMTTIGTINKAKAYKKG